MATDTTTNIRKKKFQHLQSLEIIIGSIVQSECMYIWGVGVISIACTRTTTQMGMGVQVEKKCSCPFDQPHNAEHKPRDLVRAVRGLLQILKQHLEQVVLRGSNHF